MAGRLVTARDIAEADAGSIFLPNARKALAGVRNGGRMKIACIGDSNTIGYRSESSSSSLVVNASPSVFADLLAKHFTVSRDSVWGGGGSGIGAANLAALDPRIALNAGWVDGVTGTNVGLAGGSLVNNTNANALSFTPVGAWNTADIYAVGLAAGTETYSADVGGTATNFSPTAFVTTKSTYSPGSKAVQTLNLKKVAGSNINHFAIDCYDNTTGHVAIWNIGHSGSKATDWASSAASAIYGKFPLLALLTAHLSVIQLGLNDYDNAVSIASYIAAMQTVITQQLTTGDVVLVVPAPPGAATVGGGPAWSEFVAAIYALAVTNNLPVIDLTRRFVDYSTMNALGLRTDVLHPNKLGYGDSGLALYGFFMRAVGA